MGVVLRKANDPPGQRSRYIRPGNWEVRNERLATFESFPLSDFRKLTKLADSGFHYTGYQDRVKCHGCGNCVEQWQENDDPTHPGWHNTGCKFRRESTEHTHTPMNQMPSEVQQSTPSTSGQNYGRYQWRSRVGSNSAHMGDPNISTREATFPCNNPVNPHMREENARLQTFRDRIDHWPSHRIQATPQEIARAGLYYLGQGDRVKCWYCNGGLQNWDRFDEPWFEHAKWFPMCEFVLRNKGPDFVNQIVARFPNIDRPGTINSIQYPFARGQLPAGVLLTSNIHLTGNDERPKIIEPRKRVKEINRKVQNEMDSSERVQQAKDMGFADREIRAALRKQLEMHDTGFDTFVSMVDAILALNADEKEQNCEYYEREDEPPSDLEKLTSVASSFAVDDLRNGLREIERFQQCKICFKSRASIVLLPCGHVASCNSCANFVKACPLCKLPSNDWVKSYQV